MLRLLIGSNADELYAILLRCLRFIIDVKKKLLVPNNPIRNSITSCLSKCKQIHVHLLNSFNMIKLCHCWISVAIKLTTKLQCVNTIAVSNLFVWEDLNYFI